ncbi:CPXV166 protein, partial [Monkeypox virus]
TSSG